MFHTQRFHSNLFRLLVSSTLLVLVLFVIIGCNKDRPKPPDFKGFSPDPPSVVVNESIPIQYRCDENDYDVYYHWEAEAGEIIGNGRHLITYLAPSIPGEYGITLTMKYQDSNGEVIPKICWVTVTVSSDQVATDTPTATRSPFLTPTGTPTATFTLTFTPTSTPTATSSPTPTTTDTPTTTFTPSSTPTFTLAPYPPPELIGAEPLDCNVTFKWTWTGTLAWDEYFAVRAWKTGSQDHKSLTWTEKHEYTHPFSEGGDYSWQIAICRGIPGSGHCSGDEELAVSELGFFQFGGCPPTPTPTDTPTKPTPPP